MKTLNEYKLYAEETFQEAVYDCKFIKLQVDFAEYNLLAGDLVFYAIDDIGQEIILYEDRFTGAIKEVNLKLMVL